MGNYIITTSNKQTFLVRANSELESKIKFSQKMPSLKIVSVKVVDEDIYEVK